MTKGFQAHHGGNKTFFKWVGKGLLHAIGWCWGQIWKVFKDSIKAIGQEIGKLLGKTWRLIVRIVLIIALIWAVWTYLVHPSHLYPRGKALVDEVLTVFHGEKANPAPTVPPAPVASLSPVKPNPQRAKRVEQVRPEPPQGVERAKPAVSSLPTANRELPTVVLPWTSDEEPLETYQDELSLVPRLCLLKLNPVIPDAEISVDMAIRRVNDLQDGERYAIFIGRDRHKVLSATPKPHRPDPDL